MNRPLFDAPITPEERQGLNSLRPDHMRDRTPWDALHTPLDPLSAVLGALVRRAPLLVPACALWHWGTTYPPLGWFALACLILGAGAWLRRRVGR